MASSYEKETCGSARLSQTTHPFDHAYAVKTKARPTPVTCAEKFARHTKQHSALQMFAIFCSRCLTNDLANVQKKMLSVFARGCPCTRLPGWGNLAICNSCKAVFPTATLQFTFNGSLHKMPCIHHKAQTAPRHVRETEGKSGGKPGGGPPSVLCTVRAADGNVALRTLRVDRSFEAALA